MMRRAWLHCLLVLCAAVASGAERAPGNVTAPSLATSADDRYELRDEIGRGGMGIVYLASDRELGRAVAIASIPVAFYFDALTIWQLYIVGFAVGCFTVFFDVAYQSYLELVVSMQCRDQ